jgi:acyl-coenzyme A synthetase/AMP-(fatty) acid ligase
LERVVVVPYLPPEPDLGALGRATTLAAFLAPHQGGEIRFEQLPFKQLPFNHPLYIMYSSGTTGVPKCIVHGAGGTLLKQLSEHLLHGDVQAGERVFYITTCGWMMWNWLVAALADRIRQQIRSHTNPRHVPARIVAVTDIPRTKSGKIVELAVRDLIHGRPVANWEALANPEALELFRDLPELWD